jgi:hypothetical protein
MINIKEVDRECCMVTVDTEAGSATMNKGRVISQIGFITPAEQKKIKKLYYSIFKK